MRLVRLWVGIVLVAVGVFGILDAAGIVGFGVTVGRWWPLAVIGLGLSAMWSERRVSFGPVAVTGLGLMLLAGQLEWADRDLFWPALLLLAGAALLAGLWRRETGRPAREDSLVMFGGAKTVDRSEHFRHADVAAIFGGATLDLRHAHVDGEASVDAFALFGGVDVLVPKDWQVTIGGLPILGGYDDKTTGGDEPRPDAPHLKVNATAVFGGVGVANEPK
ncbi:hypothetical protein [Amycolatopsis sp. NPDC059657]|uniref:LiaF transmembrane domain-containing protein n=1 Tax=Amycolatopsis sp. NPDC059657 TaxID=3346899 RepID=UPI00366ECAE1